jgi:hypothetical protein
MKAMIIADTDAPVQKITDYLAPYGFDAIRYRSAVKAIDNIEEIGPDAVFISAVDFPRHWKTISQFIRADTDKDRTVIVLLTNERFSSDDADKAAHIGVQAIVDEALAGSGDEHQLFEVFARYKQISGETRLPQDALDRIRDKAAFMFTNPVSETIITGKVESLSEREIMFKPDAPAMTADLASGETIDSCSLKLDDKILNPNCRVRKNGYLLALEITNADSAQDAAIKSFISTAK